MPIRPEKRPFMRRVQPWIGALIMVMSLVPLGLVLTSGRVDSKGLGGLATGLFMAGGGATLIAKGAARRSHVAIFALGALAVAVAAVVLLRGSGQ